MKKLRSCTIESRLSTCPPLFSNTSFIIKRTNEKTELVSFTESNFEDNTDTNTRILVPNSSANSNDIQSHIDSIRSDILGRYNYDIPSYYFYLYYFIYWFETAQERLHKFYIDENTRHNILSKLINFDEYLNPFSAQNATDEKTIQNRLKTHNKNDIYECIDHEQLRLIYNTYNYVSDNNIIIELICNTVHNIQYINLITKDYNIDNEFILKWEYNPVPTLFNNLINETKDSEDDKSIYHNLKQQEIHLYNATVSGDYNFQPFKKKLIKKENKTRVVYEPTTVADKVILKYLSKRIKEELNITYPNRDKIMDICFDLIDSLPRLEDFTLYRFDFKDFFDNVDSSLIYNKYIIPSSLSIGEKKLIKKVLDGHWGCRQGLPTSNALIELTGRDFDENIKSYFLKKGLIFYKRYVDDCILIFNQKILEDEIHGYIISIIKDYFGKRIKISPTKTVYQTKYTPSSKFDYLGYSFELKPWINSSNGEIIDYYFQFGIASKKQDKYKAELDHIINAYNIDHNSLLLLRRIQFYNSRIVFFNYSKNSDRIWNVSGIIETYKLLRKYIILDDENIKKDIVRNQLEKIPRDGGKNHTNSVPHRIDPETIDFLKNTLARKTCKCTPIPQFLLNQRASDHSLWHAFINKHSIVFQANVGWSNKYLRKRCRELKIDISNMKYSEKASSYYKEITKK